VYLPKGDWFDWWTNEKITGGQTISRPVNLETMPLFVRAGAIIPVDPVRQYADQPVSEPTTLKVYSGMDGRYTLYEDDGISQEYLAKKGTWTSITWNEKQKKLTLAPGAPAGFTNITRSKTFTIELIPGNATKTITYPGKPVSITF
jgi:alpha-glucosidase/alpha-D-xyloside xylohydrolase